MTIYIVMVDTDGTMRSSEDTPVAAFKTQQAAESYIKQNTVGGSVCGGYAAVIKKVELKD